MDGSDATFFARAPNSCGRRRRTPVLYHAVPSRRLVPRLDRHQRLGNYRLTQKIYSHPLSTPQNPRRAGELDRRGANVEARPAILLVESRAAFSTGPALPTSEASHSRATTCDVHPMGAVKQSPGSIRSVLGIHVRVFYSLALICALEVRCHPRRALFF